jgi:hypothetical protein
LIHSYWLIFDFTWGKLEVPISEYVTYFNYEGENADFLVREIKKGVFKVLIREYNDNHDTEFIEKEFFVKKDTLDALFEEYNVMKKPTGTEKILEPTHEIEL